MAGMVKKDVGARGETINLRATRKQKTVLLDRRYFALSGEAFRRFTAMLDKPPASNPKLRRLIETKAPWDR
jgi:uncharacterized protein (DUF1778 family)